MRDEEHEAILTIPPVVSVAVVGVQPATLVVAIDAENVRVAVGVGLYKAPSVPLLTREHRCSIHKLYRIPHRNAIVLYTKYLHFLKCLHKPSV